MPDAPNTPTINLTSTISATAPVPVPQAKDAKATIDIIADTSVYPWASAVVELQWSIELGTNENWNSLATPITLTSSTNAKRAVAVEGAGYIRLKVTTAEGGSDPNAKAIITIIT